MELACPACANAVVPEQFDEQGQVTCPCGVALMWDGELRRLDELATRSAAVTLIARVPPAATVAPAATSQASGSSELACPACAEPADPEQFDEQGRVTCACGVALLWDGELRRADQSPATVAVPIPPSAAAPAVVPAPAPSVAVPGPPSAAAPAVVPGPVPAAHPAPRRLASAGATAAALPHTRIHAKPLPAAWGERDLPSLAPGLRMKAPERSDRWMYVLIGVASVAMIGVLGYHVSRRKPAPAAAATLEPDAGGSKRAPAPATVAASPVPPDPAPVPPAPAPVPPSPTPAPDPVPPAPAPAPDPIQVADSTLASTVPAPPRLPALLFERDSIALPASTAAVLERARAALDAAPTSVLEIHGHTDDEGKRDLNVELSLRRANAVRDWMIARGIEATRLTAVGHGPDRPVSNATGAAARARNRRVELVLVGWP